MDGPTASEYNTDNIPLADKLDYSYSLGPGLILCKYRQHTFGIESSVLYILYHTLQTTRGATTHKMGQEMLR